jgi:ABC-type uncharacterized transport system YnjBCD ATPase subunit
VHLAVDDALVIGDPLSDRTHLRRELEHLGLGVGRDDRRDAAVERVGERGQVSRPPRQLDCLPAQPVAALTRMLVAQRPRQSGEKPDTELDVTVRERREPVLEQRDELGVSSGSRPDDPSAVAGGRARELPRQPEPSGEIGRCKKRLLR